MWLLYVGLTLGTLGKIILGIAVIRVHARIFEQHKIDGLVLSAIQREKYITTGAIVLIVLGYILEMFFYGTSTIVFS